MINSYAIVPLSTMTNDHQAPNMGTMKVEPNQEVIHMKSPSSFSQDKFVMDKGKHSRR